MYYTLYGNMGEVSRITGIPSRTLRGWRTKPWWEDFAATVRREIDSEIEAGLQQQVRSAIAQIADRINNGDVKVLSNGKRVRAPVSAKDLAVTMSIMFDKLRLVRNQPTQIKQEGSTAAHLQQLADKIRELQGSDFRVIDIEGDRVDENK